MKRRMIGAGIAGIALLVAGCGAGQITQTDQQVGMVDGAAAEADTIFIRNAEIAYPDHVQPAAYLEGDDATWSSA
ncbi:hypothetical protein [Saccharomonospora sp. CUA-673]|uniref:hypothetical protein n=1 Tax=Saccharomonospora sp. CUA-673 TaxID=1904969 RepID=UPI000B2F64C7|nr:hypothetical protein [Saccharomonospora sp. CUA-673]